MKTQTIATLLLLSMLHADAFGADRPLRRTRVALKANDSQRVISRDTQTALRPLLVDRVQKGKLQPASRQFPMLQALAARTKQEVRIPTESGSQAPMNDPAGGLPDKTVDQLINFLPAYKCVVGVAQRFDKKGNLTNTRTIVDNDCVNNMKDEGKGDGKESENNPDSDSAGDGGTSGDSSGGGSSSGSRTRQSHKKPSNAQQELSQYLQTSQPIAMTNIPSSGSSERGAYRDDNSGEPDNDGNKFEPRQPLQMDSSVPEGSCIFLETEEEDGSHWVYWAFPGTELANDCELPKNPEDPSNPDGNGSGGFLKKFWNKLAGGSNGADGGDKKKKKEDK